ncbi:NUDIX domain-containing protein [Dehalococcoidia bacterium]|nr:NUDIX domain-containing protein [Dehalococcoidia bacterium]
MGELDWTMNPFGGAVIEPKSLNADPDMFSNQIDAAIVKMKETEVKVAWLNIPHQIVAVVPVAAKRGFTFHHAESGYAMMTLQIEDGAFIPPYATHYIGIGGVVLNKRQELLVVSERYRMGGRGPSYKLPGGALQPGEHLEEAAVREVEEETGVKTEFDALVCFRHWHGYRYGKSDIYFVARLTALSEGITMQEEEISECLWMPVDDFLNSDDIHVFNKTIVQSALEGKGVSPIKIHGYEPAEKFEFFMPPEIHIKAQQ